MHDRHVYAFIDQYAAHHIDKIFLALQSCISPHACLHDAEELIAPVHLSCSLVIIYIQQHIPELSSGHPLKMLLERRKIHQALERLGYLVHTAVFQPGGVEGQKADQIPDLSQVLCLGNIAAQIRDDLVLQKLHI